jgi:putative Ca2+/H+ antiporter (TMEM165/GDT1 family)
MDWKLFLSTFGIIFLAELGDKTQLATLTLSAESRNPWVIFIAASLALTGITLIAALTGGLISQFIPRSLLARIAGLAFVVMGVWIFFKG